jgi:PhnB protein
MSQRPAKPAGYPWMSSCLQVKDPNASIDFYQRAFGFEKKMAMPGPDGKIMHAELTYRDTLLMLGPEGWNGAKTPASSGATPSFGVYVYCPDVDALYARATAAGAVGVQPPQDMFYGDRVCKVTDPDGYYWMFATNIADFDPAKVPAA